MVTFGIVPDAPETGFGYIRKGDAMETPTAHRLDAFVEKPDRKRAEAYLSSGDYLWNSGIFMLRAGRWMELIEEFQPDIAAQCRAAYKGGVDDLDFHRLERDAFERCPSDSIDYVVMEPLSQKRDGNVAVIPLDAGWSDIGAWNALWAVEEQDGEGNAVHGDVYTHDAHNNLLHAQDRMIAAVGVNDLVVVETTDAVLVVHKDRAQDVKKVSEYLEENCRDECDLHRRVHRPWGSFEGVDQGERFQVKRLTVKPGASLSPDAPPSCRALGGGEWHGTGHPW